jgi:hypothetical protein
MKKTRGLKSHDNVSLSGHFEQAELRLKSQISHFIAGAGVFFLLFAKYGATETEQLSFPGQNSTSQNQNFYKNPKPYENIAAM